MIVIGITGPSGAGKGVVSKYLREQGIHVIDADAVYHDCITPPSDCLDELVRNFGRRILTGDGSLNRPALAAIVFGEQNKEKLLLLNQITHKYVLAKIKKTVSGLRAVGAEACAIDAPLLIESGLDQDCDFVLSVLAGADKRAERIAKRDSIDMEAAFKRINSQKPDDFYKESSDIVLYNDGEIEALLFDLNRYLKERGVIYEA